MATLKNGSGEFLLSDSDHNIGSFFNIDDLLDIFNIDESKKIDVVASLTKEGILSGTNPSLLDEKDLYSSYEYLIKAFSKDKYINASSFDEYVLMAILKHCYPNVYCERQYPVKISDSSRIKIDFYIINEGKELFVEFDGPNHFYKQKQYNNTIEDPFVRVEKVQQATGIRMVRWPYWVQRCERNFRVLFEPDKYKQGYGALWSTNILFGDFDNSIANWAEIIKKLNKQFKLEHNNSIGYFYGNETDLFEFDRKQPQHPVIGECLKGKVNKERLIPKGGGKELGYWLPEVLLNS